MSQSSTNLYPALPILHVDDEKSWLLSLSVALERTHGINHVISCSDSREVTDILARQPVSLVILDLNMPNLSGEDLLGRIAESHPEIPVIILTGRNQIETAVNCMRLGAFDFFIKTMEDERIFAGVRRALQLSALKEENRRLSRGVLQDGLEHPAAFEGIVTGNAQMRSICRYLEAVAQSGEPVLITGESGVGKELFARAVHRLGRPHGPMVALNVAGLDDNVFSDTLFGHTRGAFTGALQTRAGMIEQAADGTLFLDEIGDLDPVSQVKLLRLLQEREYLPLGSDRPKSCRARMVAATNQPLAEIQQRGRFRKDLYYRLCAHQVRIPPLRERQDDIPLLLAHFLEEAACALGKKRPTPPRELQVLLATYHFPGNVRELRAMVFNAVSLHQKGKLSMQTFRQAIESGRAEAVGAEPVGVSGAVSGGPVPAGFASLQEAVNAHVSEALRLAVGNQTIAARMLGISGAALSKRLKKRRC